VTWGAGREQVEDLVGTIPGTTLQRAEECGLTRAVCVECGQHDAPSTTAVAEAVIRRFLTGDVLQRAKHVLTCTARVMLRKGELVAGPGLDCLESAVTPDGNRSRQRCRRLPFVCV
jgi:hypothetical protein